MLRVDFYLVLPFMVCCSCCVHYLSYCYFFWGGGCEEDVLKGYAYLSCCRCYVLMLFICLFGLNLVQMKTGCVALVLCLNISVDPPDVIKISPCARMECWIGAFTNG